MKKEAKKEKNVHEFVDKNGVSYIAKRIKQLENTVNTNMNDVNGLSYNFFSDSISEGLVSEQPLCFARGRRSHAEGIGTEANNIAEHASGKYNVSHENTQYSVGVGTSRTERINAIEIMNNGQVFINGIGGYDGTNPNEALSVQTIINQLVTKINELENHD